MLQLFIGAMLLAVSALVSVAAVDAFEYGLWIRGVIAMTVGAGILLLACAMLSGAATFAW